MRIAIGCPVRNRAWVLPEYLAALWRIDMPEENRRFIFLENDSEDETWDLLGYFSDMVNDHPYDRTNYGKCIVRDVCTKVEHWDRGDYSANQYGNLAEIRNQYLQLFLQTDADYLLSIDSDIIVPPDIINRLLEHADENSIIGAAISNIPGRPLDGSTPGNFMVKKQGMIVHPNPYPLTGSMDVDVIGAVYLIPRKVLEDGVKYAPHPQGEDIPFCEQAQEKGYRLRVLLDVVCEHKMTRE